MVGSQPQQEGVYAGQTTTIGWRETCDCAAPRAPCRVLDPFGGTGTAAIAADELGHDCTLIELNPEYAQMARERIASTKARRMIGDREPKVIDERQLGMFG